MRSSALHLLALGALAAGASSSCTCRIEGGGAPAGSASAVGKGAKGDVGDGPGGESLPPGTYVADSGFRPDKDGFRFPNGTRDRYPDGKPFLTTAVMVRLFGKEKVCAPSAKDLGKGAGAYKYDEFDGAGDFYVEDDKKPGDAPPPAEDACVPLPAAAQWMDQINRKMNDGQCEGMAVASLMVFKRQEDAAKYQPGAATAHDLDRDANDAVRELIAFYFTQQFLDPVESRTLEVKRDGTPSVILDKIVEGLKSDDPFTLGFYQAGVGGHAVTPYAVEDKGNQLFWVRVYDNNHPDKERYMEIDKGANTWKYGLAALNPSQDARPWSGDVATHTLDLTPLSLRKVAPSSCPFCESSPNRQVFLQGEGHLLIDDGKGGKLGFEGGSFVSTLPGSHPVFTRGILPSGAPVEPTYVLPGATDYAITLDGKGVAQQGDDDIVIFGAGAVIVIDDVKLDPGQVDHLSLSADGRTVKYKPGGREQPLVRIAFDAGAEDWLFEIKDLSAAAGEELSFTIDPVARRLGIRDSGGADKYDLRMVRFGARGVDTYKNDDIELGAGDVDLIDFGAWAGGHAALKVLEDKGGDGTIDKTIEEPDEE